MIQKIVKKGNKYRMKTVLEAQEKIVISVCIVTVLYVLLQIMRGLVK